MEDYYCSLGGVGCTTTDDFIVDNLHYLHSEHTYHGVREKVGSRQFRDISTLVHLHSVSHPDLFKLISLHTRRLEG